NKAPRHHNDNFESDKRFIETVAELRVIYWQSSNDIDIFLCRWLPSSHEDLDNSCIIDKILSFDDTNADKVTKFKQMLKNER
ncbi:hypothetical protein, partial [Bacteroides faecis]|uniref:hypothetical protein n=1 Tax=Bacteroides faecis TaxID=674529 RepID=UPI0034A2C65D